MSRRLPITYACVILLWLGVTCCVIAPCMGADKQLKTERKKKRKKSLASSSQRLWSVFALMAGYVPAMLGPVEQA